MCFFTRDICPRFGTFSPRTKSPGHTIFSLFSKFMCAFLFWGLSDTKFGLGWELCPLSRKKKGFHHKIKPIILIKKTKERSTVSVFRLPLACSWSHCRCCIPPWLVVVGGWWLLVVGGWFGLVSLVWFGFIGFAEFLNSTNIHLKDIEATNKALPPAPPPNSPSSFSSFHGQSKGCSWSSSI